MTAATSTEVVERTPMQDTIARIRGDQFKQEIADALPGGVTPDRFVRATITAIMQNPEVIVDPPSLLQSVIRCAQDGLMPDGREAALVVFNVKGDKKVQYMPMIGGLRKIAAEHDITVEAYVVYENDFFEWELGFSPTITHRPPKLNESRGEAIGAYAVATLTDPGKREPQKFLEVMSRGEIEEVRKVSRAKDNGPWVSWWGEMARKTVARRMFKQLPLGELDEREEQLLRQVDVDVAFDAEPRMTVDEANVTAGLTGAKPPLDGGPDDAIAATPEHHGQLLAVVIELTNMDPDVDWQQNAGDFALATFDLSLDKLNGEQFEQVLAHLRDQLPEIIT